MSEVFARLQGALQDRYRLDREIGGGGMSRVFLAEEVALHRRVVIKVLPPEMSLGVNAERFRREIQLAASLQHPHIVPLLTAGSSDDLLYYVMPLVEGESLRAKLVREGELPIPEALRIVADVAAALAYAHHHGVVHRDIKPDNILLSGEFAVVTDFGVAKAVSEAAAQASITSVGVALGTPAYMAPEQAMADPHVDHRADIYALGAVTYEMLCGRPPFVAPTPQVILAAHVTQAPEPCVAHRPTVSPALNELVMRCLEKKAADRPQRAEEVAALVRAMTTPSGGMAPTGATEISSGTRDAIARHHPVRVVARSVVAALIVLATVFALARLVGLPAWLIPATVAVLAVGVPLLVATGHYERRRLIERSTGVVRTTPQQGLTRHQRWRKTLLGGGNAVAGLALLTGAYMAMRVLGIGPLGTLLAKGALAERDALVIADFSNQTGDSMLGRTIQELLRIDLEQSPVVTVVQPERVANALQRMRRSPNLPLTRDVARDVAQREGAKGLLAGEVTPLGGGYVVTARLLNAASGEVLAARRATAETRDALIDAVDQVSRGLRERIGESLRRVQGGRPLEAVTTTSLEALQKYMRAQDATTAGEYARARQLLREAIHLDTNFAMAYRLLAARLRDIPAPYGQVAEATARAYALRQRLPERERLLAEASYYAWVTEDDSRAITAYRALLDEYPTEWRAWNNVALAYRRLRRWAEAESAYTRTIQLHQGAAHTGLMTALVQDGKIVEAEEILHRWRELSPRHPELPSYEAQFAILRGDYARAEAIVREAVPAWRAAGPARRANAASWLQGLAMLGGRMREARRQAAEYRAASREEGSDRLPGAVRDAMDDLVFALWYSRAQADAAAAFDAVVASGGLDSVPPVSREYPTLVQFFGLTGDAARARQYLDRYEREVTDEGPRTRAQTLTLMRGMVALAEQRWPDAISELRTWQDSSATLGLVLVAYAHDLAAQPDSAISLYERWLTTPGWRAYWEAWWLPRTLRRLGELHEARGERRQAREYYRRFADLWKNADLEFQPMVREARAKAARLDGS